MNKQYNFVFNTKEWAKIVTECYGFKDYSLHSDNAHLPLFYSNSPLFGKKIVSAVFNTYAEPIYSNVKELDEIVGKAIQIARNNNVQYLEIKSINKIPNQIIENNNLHISSHYKTTILELDKYDDVFNGYKKQFKQNIRTGRKKLESNGIRIYRSKNFSDLSRYYNLLVKLYRDTHLMIPQPFKLFKLIFEYYIKKDNGDFWVAKTADDKLIGGIITLLNEKNVTYSLGATDEKYKQYAPNIHLVDNAIHYYCNNGFKLFDFGISSPNQKGLVFFKSRWGGKTIDLPYYYYLVRAKEVPKIDFSNAYMWIRKPIKLIPVSLIKVISSIIVKKLN
jgi:tetratricopeptide (TPR) repeat protein